MCIRDSIRPVGQVVKTRPFHGCNMGSNPVRVTTVGGLAQLVRAPASHAGGHWFESSSLHQKVPDFVRNQELFLFMFSNSDAAFGRFLRDPKAERSGKHGRERRGRGCSPARPCAASPFYSFNPREYPTRTVWHSIQKKSMFFASYPCY